MSFKFFHERLPWQPKLPCNFHKNFIYVIETLSLIFLWKISFLAQRVHVSEILRHFSQFYPTHSRLVYDLTGTLLALLYGEVPHMLPAKYQPNPPGGSGEEDFWRVFYHIWAWRPSWISDQKHFSYFSFPQCLDATYEIWLHLAQWFRGEVVWKCGRTTEASHTISSPGAFGSGELKRASQFRWKNSLFTMYFGKVGQ